MKKFILQIIFIFIPLIASAEQSDIYAIVDDHPITKFDFNSKKQMIVRLNKIDLSNPSINAQVNQNIINNLIEEELLKHHAKKLGIEISDSDVKEAIKQQELSQGMKVGQARQYLKSVNVSYDDYFEHTRTQLIKQNIMSSIASSLDVSDTEIDSVLTDNIENFNVEAWVFTAKSNDRNTRSKMERLKKRKLQCEKIDTTLYSNFADAEMFNKESINANKMTSTVISDTNVGAFSPVYKEDGKLKLLFVCKKLRAIPIDGVHQIKNAINNKKVIRKFTKFLNDLRAKSYIKIMLP